MKKYKKKKDGFTLVELLATIIVLGILVGIVVYVTTSVISRSKEKSYQVTIHEIESNADNYLAENTNRLFYLKNIEKEYEYQCVTVENLVDYGYLDNEVTNSNVSSNSKAELGDYIYIERDIYTKAVTKTLYTKTNPEYIDTCAKAINALGDITFTSSPGFNEWSKYKDVTITYRLKNLNDQRTLNDYKFNHSYIGQSTHDSTNDTLENNTKTKLVRVTSNGDLSANIMLNNESIASAKKKIDKIDIVGPVISLDSFSEKKVHGQVKLPLKVTDFGIGVDYSTFTKEDIVVKVGNTIIDNIKLEHGSNEKYNLTITNDKIDGNIKIYIAKDKVFDKLKNGNLDIEIDTKISFENIFTITYNANGGSGAPAAMTYTYASSGTVNLSTTKPTRTGHTFLGWSTNKNATTATYAAGGAYPRNITNNVILYAVWKANTYTITYSANGGSGTPAATTYIYATSGTINLSTTKPTRTGYTFLGWSTSSGATSATYASGAAYNRNNAKNITLYAVWKVNTYKITYSANGGSGAPAAQSYTYATSGTINLSTTKPTRTGYTFLGWSISSSATSATYASGAAYNRNNAKNITLYAVWKVNTYKITYSANGGSGAPSATTYTYAASGTVKLSTTKPTRTGYTFLGWSTSSSATSATYAAGAAYNRNNAKNITLYAVWKVNTYKITYSANGGSGAPAAQSYTYATSGTINLSTTKPTRTSYTFLGWSTSSSATSATYASGAAYNRNNAKNVTLYAVWKQAATFIFHYSGSFKYTDGSASEVSGNNANISIQSSNWVVKFLTSGTLTVKSISTNIDVFLVGGGGGAGRSNWENLYVRGGGGGGGGYTTTWTNIGIKNQGYAITIGAGGGYNGSGGTSTAFGYSASGGYSGSGFSWLSDGRKEAGGGGSGGSGGGGICGGYGSMCSDGGGAGGSNGSYGSNGITYDCTGRCVTYGSGGGSGCASNNGCKKNGAVCANTRAFCESTGELYAGGGAGSDHENMGAAGSGGGRGGNTGGHDGSVSCNTAVANTGGGGANICGGSGNSGIVIIRNKR